MAADSQQTAFVFGAGYLGYPVAKGLLREGWEVGLLTRSAEKAKNFRAEGFSPVVGDWRSWDIARRIPPASRILIAVGHDSRTGSSRRETYVEGLRRVLPAIPAEAEVVYVSSTGVYHQDGGVWVDEFSPARPQSEGGRAHLEAESLLCRTRRSGIGKTVVLRMAGLYGPSRVPRLAAMRPGVPLAIKDGFLNLIHQRDAVRAILGAWNQPEAQPLYVVSDGTPVCRRDFYREVAKHLGLRELEFTEGPGGRSEGSKRVWSARMQRDLVPRLEYPSFREGLAQIFSR